MLYSPRCVEVELYELRLNGVLGSSSLLGAAHRTQRYTLWIGKLVAWIACR